MGEGGGGGGPGRERVGELEPRKWAVLLAAGARGHPAARGSDRGQCLENCGLRCLCDAMLLELRRKMDLVLH